MSFVERVEAAQKLIVKPAKPVKPKKRRGANPVVKPKLPIKPKKGPQPYRFAKKALGAQKKIQQMNFSKVRRLMPKIYQLLSIANPFGAPGPNRAPDATWGKFFAQVAPELIANLLWDLGEFDREDLPAAVRYFKQRVKL